VLEHVRQKDVPRALNGIRRVLKPRGQFLVSVPDRDILCHAFISPLASHEDKWLVVRMMLGGQADEHDFHYRHDILWPGN
jgi:predicted SAM-dependent methyltransferase